MKLKRILRKYLRMIKLHRIINAFSILKKEGLSGLRYHFFLVKEKEKGREEKYKNLYDVTVVYHDKEHSFYKKIIFEQFEKPLVSIIIPVYNQFEYTYNCLLHINKYTINIPYEIIIADDFSTDMTKIIETLVEGVNIIHNEKNFQFLKNCNYAAQKAKGKYIHFLNNDTQVQSKWLESLIQLMESDESIGIVGSKLIYPDGTVQEAGGIVWKNATVLQFGNKRYPDEPELNYRRAVDYISGASILIRRKLWDQIGGFDIQFAPAYYEDVDLAFEVRRRGYIVVYQPESEVIHFEGVTESLDENNISRIEDNRKQFYRKWKYILDKQYYNSEDYPKLMKEMKLKREKHG